MNWLCIPYNLDSHGQKERGGGYLLYLELSDFQIC